MGNEIPDAHKRIVERIKEKGFDFSSAKAVDLFAREGDWHSKEYQPQVAAYDAWEIDTQFEENLRKNLPDATVKITDTFEEVKTTDKRFSLVLCDNAQSVYGDKDQFCEHFELFPSIFRIMEDECVLVINTNIEPYDFHEGVPWWNRRKEFYGVDDPSKLSLEFLEQFYKKKCEDSGYVVEWSFFEPLNSFVHMLVVYLKKK